MWQQHVFGLFYDLSEKSKVYFKKLQSSTKSKKQSGCDTEDDDII